jgi:2-dehydro-3-deoxyphosphogluconate aldolase/(4S)-4-hydroxy-2-oxoglutarate aldolase
MPSSAFPALLADALHRAGVVATLVIDDADDAVPLARALADGGVRCLELTLRTASALESLRRIRSEVPELIVGAGTILSPQLVLDSLQAGAAFGVAPGMNPRVVKEAQKLGLPFAPGVCTPSDIERALEMDCALLKFFPCEPCGGLSYLRTVAAPFTHLGVKFIPLGGIHASNAERYLREPMIAAVGGSWLAPREVLQRKDWAAITALAREAAEIVRRARGGGA